MPQTDLAYTADGIDFVSTLYTPDAAAGPVPGVLVFPDALGLGLHNQTVARRLAVLGYAALACDIHGGGHRFPDLATALAAIKPMREQPGVGVTRSLAALTALQATDGVDPARIASIGYCFGGTMTLELARRGAPIVAAVSLHGSLGTQIPAGPGLRPRILACLGADDPGIDRDQRNAFEAEMTAAGADWQSHVYGGVLHGFTDEHVNDFADPTRAAYHATADRRSWAAMTLLLEEAFD